MANNIFQESVTPDKPKSIASQQITVYVPRATLANKGIASFSDPYGAFIVNNGNVSLNRLNRNPLARPDLIQLDTTYFTMSDGIVYFDEGNPTEKPSLIMIKDKVEGLEVYTEDGHNYLRTYLKTINGSSLVGNTDLQLVTPAQLDTRLSYKQDKTDNNLATNDKTVVGAINEVNITASTAMATTHNKVDKLRTSGNFTGKIENGKSVSSSLQNDIYLSAREVNNGVTEESYIDMYKNIISIYNSESSSLANAKMSGIELRKDEMRLGVLDMTASKSKILKIDIDKVTIDDKKIPEALTTYSTSQEDTYAASYINNIADMAIGRTSSYTISDITNVAFNSNNDTITLPLSGTITDVEGNIISLSSLKLGDIIWITDLDVPDRWVGSIANNSIVFYKMEATKIDLTNYVTVSEFQQVTSGLQTQVNNKVNKTQIATISQAGLVYGWEDIDGLHIWLSNPYDVIYTEENGVYVIKTLNYTEENGVYNIGGNNNG